MLNDFLIWQLADSAFPTGGFAHSGGLEAAWQHGEVCDGRALSNFIEASLTQAGHGVLPIVRAAHGEPHRLGEWDRLCDAFLSNHVANRASRVQGQAFLTVAQRCFPSPALSEICGMHFAPVFGATAYALGLTVDQSSRLFLFMNLRGLISSAVRLGIIGPMEGQSLQHRLASNAEAIATQPATPLEEIAQIAPLLEIWQGSQDRLYSRLFQS